MSINLWIDTASSGCNMALTQDGQVLAVEYAPMQRGQAEALLPMLEQCLKQASITLEQISMIIATRGPGSFTGVRIGLACAKTLALCLKVPLKTITNFDMLYHAYQAAHQLDGKNCLLSINSFRFEPFIQLVVQGKAQVPQVADDVEISQIMQQYSIDLLLGDTDLNFWDSYNFTQKYNSKDDILLQHLLAAENVPHILPLSDDSQAFYIRDADASISKTKHKTVG